MHNYKGLQVKLLETQHRRLKAFCSAHGLTVRMVTASVITDFLNNEELQRETLKRLSFIVKSHEIKQVMGEGANDE